VDEHRLYWSTFGAPSKKPYSDSKSYHACFKLDCAHTATTYATFDGGSNNFVVDDQQVYWTQSDSELFSCSKDDCAGSTEMIAVDPALFGRRIAAHQGYVYWSSDTDLLRCRASGSAVPEVVARSTVTNHLAFDGARVYWQTEQGIFRAPSDGSEPPELMTAALPRPQVRNIYENDIGDIAVAGGHLYWRTERRIYRCPVANCIDAGPTLLYTGDKFIDAFKIDDEAMYWLEGYTTTNDPTEHAKLALRSCPLSGCKQSTVRSDQPVELNYSTQEGAAYAIDANDLYWLEAPSEPQSPTLSVLHKTAK